jgi:hypothetical protein
MKINFGFLAFKKKPSQHFLKKSVGEKDKFIEYFRINLSKTFLEGFF